MSRLSEQLGAAMKAAPIGAGGGLPPGFPEPIVDPLVRPDGLLVKVARLRNEDYPGRGAQGVLPIFVVGHESMTEEAWGEWVREHGIPSYGAGYTERVIRDGIELKEMLPTAGFGRHMRARRPSAFDSLEQTGALIAAVEKWPDLYNQIATEMGEQQMTLGAFLGMVRTLPLQWATGRPGATTLGDILSPSLGAATPSF